MNFPRYDYAHKQTGLNIPTEGMFIVKFDQEKEDFVKSSQRGQLEHFCSSASVQIKIK